MEPGNGLAVFQYKLRGDGKRSLVKRSRIRSVAGGEEFNSNTDANSYACVCIYIYIYIYICMYVYIYIYSNALST